MSVSSDPAVHQSGHHLDPGRQENSSENRPTLPSVDEGARHRHMSRSSLAGGSDPLDGFLAFGLGEPEGIQIERLPRADVGVTTDSLLHETHAARAEGAVSVEDEEGAIHDVSVPASAADDHQWPCQNPRQLGGTRPTMGWANRRRWSKPSS